MMLSFSLQVPVLVQGTGRLFLSRDDCQLLIRMKFISFLVYIPQFTYGSPWIYLDTQKQGSFSFKPMENETAFGSHTIKNKSVI